jgi:hypothetical protein
VIPSSDLLTGINPGEDLGGNAAGRKRWAGFHGLEIRSITTRDILNLHTNSTIRPDLLILSRRCFFPACAPSWLLGRLFLRLFTDQAGSRIIDLRHGSSLCFARRNYTEPAEPQGSFDGQIIATMILPNCCEHDCPHNQKHQF